MNWNAATSNAASPHFALAEATPSPSPSNVSKFSNVYNLLDARETLGRIRHCLADLPRAGYRTLRQYPRTFILHTLCRQKLFWCLPVEFSGWQESSIARAGRVVSTPGRC